ncbi:cysteine peptidase family C39 domain-containing protein [Methylomonas sp. MO1]|uniref:cysteine peptidase family C39 domain-containing protein n=1 Tax=Methylomonas sp. MO1 TaxID=3073619 RepID=UPI0028A4B472|nr:cysteine peptidase family C39 domain-containing protein [Methylomonas sp. MO1]MDT4291008.1 cysteine peptidase family C39 domain-containing protein [Methylomonas sp. MO1]
MKHFSHSYHSSYLQTTAAECGLACLGYVAACHGTEHPMSELRAKYAVSLRGSTMMDLVGMGAALGFSCRPLRLELAELDQLSLPCILHWQMSLFAVLKKREYAMSISQFASVHPTRRTHRHRRYWSWTKRPVTWMSKKSGR